MASIRVTRQSNPITVRIGQRTVKKVVASEKAATTTLATLQELEQVQDIDVTQRAVSYTHLTLPTILLV